MQLNIIRGERATGKTTRLRQLASKFGQEDKIINAELYTVAALERTVHIHAETGAKQVFINDCSKLQIERLQQLERSLAAGLQVYAVAAA